MAKSCALEEQTLYSLFSKCYLEHADAVAVLEDTGLGRARRCWTYKELHTASEKVAQILSHIAGSTASQFVAVRMDQSLVLPAVIVGILSRGLGFAFVDSSWSIHKQNKFLKELACPCLISDNLPTLLPDNVHSSLNVAGHEIFIVKMSSDVGFRSRECVHPMAYAVQTSGSTGEPKTIRVPHSSIVPNILDLRSKLNINSSDVVFLSSPSTFDPSIVDIFLALTSGATLLVTSKPVKASPAALLKVLFPDKDGTPGVSVLQMTPSVFSRWSEREVRETVLGLSSPLRVLILGGEPCMFISKLMEYKGAENKTDIYSIYGITEVSAWASINCITNSNIEQQKSHKVKSKQCPNLGHILSDTLFQVRDLKTGSLVTDGIGEMFIGSFKRICEVDYENCLELVPPVYRGTGDIVEVSEGSFFYVGRKNHIVKRWGQRVSLHAIESLALSHEAITAACCVWDEIALHLCIFVMTKEPLENASLQRHFLVSSKGEDVLIPDEIYIVDQFPVDHHGKINRHDLMNNRKVGAAPTATSGREFISQWCRILGIEEKQILPEATFVSLGGSSILALQFSKHMEDKFGHVPDDFVSNLLSGKSFHVCLTRVINFYSSNQSGTKQFTEKMVANRHNENDDNKVLLASALGKTTDGFSQITKCYIESQEKPSISLSWQINLGKCIDASPLCIVYKSGEALIIIGSHSGKFVAIDGSSGIVKWSLLLPDRIESTACPSSCGKFTFVGCYDGSLYCINVAFGTIMWHFKTCGMIKCTPVLCNSGTGLIFGSYDHHVYCISSENGALLWKSLVISPSGSWLASPIVSCGIAVVCSLAAKLAAVETSTGHLMWSKSVKSPIFASPILLPQPFESLFVVAEVQGVLHCLHSINGNEVWDWVLKAGSHIFSSLTCAECMSDRQTCLIIFGCHDTFVYCLEMNLKLEISLHWKVTVCNPVASTPFTFSSTLSHMVNYLVVASSSGVVLILNLRNGLVSAQYQLPFEVFSSPVVHKSNIYVGCRDDNVYCLSLSYDIKSQ